MCTRKRTACLALCPWAPAAAAAVHPRGFTPSCRAAGRQTHLHIALRVLEHLLELCHMAATLCLLLATALGTCHASRRADAAFASRRADAAFASRRADAALGAGRLHPGCWGAQIWYFVQPAA